MPFHDLVPYHSSPASLFAGHARQTNPVYEGQTCYVCSKADGKLVFIGMDEVLGECWAHPRCQAKAEQAIIKSAQAG
jgi:hypothetical protein